MGNGHSDCLREKERLQSQLTEKDKEKERLQSQLTEKDKEKERLQSQLTEKDKKKERLQSQLTEKDKEKTEQIKETERLRSQLAEKDIEKTEQIKEIERLRSQLAEKDIEIFRKNEREQRLQENFESKERKLKELEEENNRLKQELESKTTIQVQIYKFNTGHLKNAEDQLCDRIKKNLEKQDKTKLEFIRGVTKDYINPDAPLLLLSFCSSNPNEVKKAAENTIDGLKLTPKMALLIVRYQHTRDVPARLSFQILSENKYGRLGGIFDFLYSEEENLFNCPINKTSIDSVVEFIEGKDVLSASVYRMQQSK